MPFRVSFPVDNSGEIAPRINRTAASNENPVFLHKPPSQAALVHLLIEGPKTTGLRFRTNRDDEIAKAEK